MDDSNIIIQNPRLNSLSANRFGPNNLLTLILQQFGLDRTQWHYHSGITRLSTWGSVLSGTVIYLGLVFGIQYLMRNRQPFKIKRISQIHNLILTFFSAFLFCCFVELLYPIWRKRGWFFTVCGYDAWTQPLEFLYYINYLVKWFELTDTLLLVLKKKKLQFLHVYHHTLTMVLCFTQLEGTTPTSCVPVVLNLMIHIIMYYYYLRASMGHRCWWKQYLTILQISQFVIDLFFVYYCTYNLIADRYFPYLPHRGPCRGTLYAAIFGCGLLSSYLLLFIQFFNRTYNSEKKDIQKTNKVKEN